nr:hypothetical protein [Sulfuriferula sp. AH1]
MLSWLTQGFGDGEPVRLKAWIARETPSRLTQPDLDVLASVTRAIHQECPLAIEYHSITSGRVQIEKLSPLPCSITARVGTSALLTGRARIFVIFVITRIKNPIVPTRAGAVA